MIWDILLIVSFSLNVLFLFYIRWILKMYTSLVEDIYAINEVILKFSEHLKSVYELEMFYGDDTLNSLMKHAREIVEKVEELDVRVVSPHKFNGCGLVISSEVIKAGVNIPKSVFFIHEDSAFMYMTNKVLGNIPQYVIKNIYSKAIFKSTQTKYT